MRKRLPIVSLVLAITMLLSACSLKLPAKADIESVDIKIRRSFYIDGVQYTTVEFLMEGEGIQKAIDLHEKANSHISGVLYGSPDWEFNITYNLADGTTATDYLKKKLRDEMFTAFFEANSQYLTAYYDEYVESLDSSNPENIESVDIVMDFVQYDDLSTKFRDSITFHVVGDAKANVLDLQYLADNTRGDNYDPEFVPEFVATYTITINLVDGTTGGVTTSLVNYDEEILNNFINEYAKFIVP